MDEMQTKRRLLQGLGEEAKKMRAEQLRRKYAPAPVDGVDEAVDGAALPTVDDVQAKLAGDGAMDALQRQGELNEGVADETLEGNNAALAELDDAKLQELLLSLKK